MEFRNVSRSFTVVNTEDGLVRVEGGDTVEVTGDRRVELANENPRLRVVEKKSSSAKSSKSAKTSTKRRSSKANTGTVTSDKVARKR